MTTDAFTTTGSHTWTNPGVSEVEVLIVGGGGGGGVTIGGGGGAGGVVWQTNVSVSGDQSLTVGSGGLGADDYECSREHGESGGNSEFSHDGGTITALGGGGGGGWSDELPLDGASGGGGSSEGNYGGTGANATQPGTNPNATIDAGSDGGDGGGGGRSPREGGGGGGAGEIGETAPNNNRSGDGGDGIDMSAEVGTTYGENGWFGGGGGGGGDNSGSGSRSRRAYGGQGGGGDGALNEGVDTYGDDALANTGGGGGAGAYVGSNCSAGYGGDGGSGIVVVKYLDPRLQMFRSPVNVSANNITGSSADISWSDKSENENGFRVYLSEDSTSWTQESDLSSNTELYSISGLENGEQYSTKIEAYNTDKTVTDTTPINKIVSTSTTISEQNTTIVFANPETISGTMNVSNTKTIDGTTIIQL